MKQARLMVWDSVTHETEKKDIFLPNSLTDRDRPPKYMSPEADAMAWHKVAALASGEPPGDWIPITEQSRVYRGHKIAIIVLQSRDDPGHLSIEAFVWQDAPENPSLIDRHMTP